MWAMLTSYYSLQQFSFLDKRINIIRKNNDYKKIEGMLSTDTQYLEERNRNIKTLTKV